MLIMQFIIFGLFIYYNGKMIELMKNFTYSNESVPNSNELNLTESTPLLKQELTSNDIGKLTSNDIGELISNDIGKLTSNDIGNGKIKNEIKENPSTINETVEQENSWFCMKMIYNFITFPILILYKLTLPKPGDRTFILTFIISIIWMTSLSYITISSVEFISKELT